MFERHSETTTSANEVKVLFSLTRNIISGIVSVNPVLFFFRIFCAPVEKIQSDSSNTVEVAILAHIEVVS